MRLRGTSSSTARRFLKLIVLAAIPCALIQIGGAASGPRPPAKSALELGLRLFNDPRMSAPEGDLANSCSSCHLLDEDPQGPRVLTDFFNRSWVPWRREDPRRTEVRNSPTIFDAAAMPRLHFDGEFASLEELVKGTLSGRPMGWLPGEEGRALDYVYKVLLDDDKEAKQPGSSYRAQFKQTFDVEIDKIGRDRTIDLVARAMSDYMRTFSSSRTTPYDRFVAANRLDAAPSAGEDPKTFGSRLLDRINALESRKSLKFAEGFDAPALRGLKVFFKTSGETSTGNCVTCHAPPLFTDASFHNMGVSQAEYDAIHGEGRFNQLPIPDAAGAKRPAMQFREIPVRQNAAFADLGFWNFVDLKGSPLRRGGETDDQFLRRMIGTFKTPSLRNLAYSSPYLHTGGINTIEDTLTELMRLSILARQGKIREADSELAGIRITMSDIESLSAFLVTLNQNAKSRIRR
jgi:cytochrome c peroxidase